MARFNFFKTPKAAPAAAVKKSKTVRPVSSVKQAQVARAALRQPVISEKATLLKDRNNAYAFKVWNGATKIEIAQEIEKTYKVKVSKVNTIHIPKKPKRMGRSHGYQAGYKKAVVYLKPGDKIDLI